jgi:hypothetical protein
MTMKKALLGLPILGASLFASPASADPYLWCAVTGAQGSEVCAFRTLAECREAISEFGGVCSPNLAYDRCDTASNSRRHHALRY